MNRDFGGGARSFLAQNIIIGMVIGCSMFFAVILLWPYHVLVGELLFGEGSVGIAVMLYLAVKRQQTESHQSKVRLQQGDLPYPEYREDFYFVPENVQAFGRSSLFPKVTQRYPVGDMPMQQYEGRYHGERE